MTPDRETIGASCRCRTWTPARRKEGHSPMNTRIWIFGALLAGLSLSLHGATATAGVVPSADAAQTIVIRDLTVSDDSVSGIVVNQSPATVRGVELRLQQVWHWKDERHPGTDSPGRTLPFTLNGDIAPNASAPFTFQTPRLPQRSDGRFVTTMDVISFSEVGPYGGSLESAIRTATSGFRPGLTRATRGDTDRHASDQTELR